MILKDTVKLATTTVDGYGDQSVAVLADVVCLFIQKTSFERGVNNEGVASDATVYLDPKNPTVLDNAYRLEGMYIIAQSFGSTQQDAWYRIQSTSVGQRKLLDNTVDNIYCRLEKVAGLPYVSIS